MVQILFNDKFDNLIEEPISYWKTLDDIPENVRNFFIEKSNSIPIFDEKNNKYYCPKCIKEINKQNKCPKCLRKFTFNNKLKIDDIKETEKLNSYIYYYVFDITQDDILLYLVKEHINYNSTFSYYPYKTSEISIDEIYQVLPNEIIDFKTNKHITHKKINELKKIFEIENKELSDEDFDIYEKFELISYENQYIYPYNLNDLKKTSIYKYTNIWLLKDYYNQNSFNLCSLVYYPIYYKEFEYLVKMKLYNLAVNYCYLVKYNGSFKNTFGVDKKYYSFMKNVDINYDQLEALKVYPTTDLDMLDFIADRLHLVKLILKYVKFDDVLSYFKKQELDINSLHEYCDYLRCCEKLKLNLKDNNILFPKHFTEQHNKITKEMIIANDYKMDERIKSLADILTLNKYEDDKYVIFPADSISGLIDESSQQSNCVRTYCAMVSNNECQIYFMRYKDNIKKSFVTIEVRNRKVVQAKTRFNKEPPEYVMNIIRKWEQTLIPIINLK